MYRPIKPPRYPSVDDIYEAEAHKAFFGLVKQPDYMTATGLGVNQKVFPDISVPMALRDDLDEFGVKQILYGIVRANDQGYGIVGAYGVKGLKNGFMFAVRLSEQPYSNAPGYIDHCAKGSVINLRGGLGDDEETNHHLAAGINRKNRFWINRRYDSGYPNTIFEVITAEPLVEGQEREGVLVEEVGIWAPPPRDVLKAANKAVKYRKNESSLAREKPDEGAASAHALPKPENAGRRRHPRHHAGDRTLFRRTGQGAVLESLELAESPSNRVVY